MGQVSFSDEDIRSGQAQQMPTLVDQYRYDVSNYQRIEHRNHRPAEGSSLLVNDPDSRQTWDIQQYEGHEAKGTQRCKYRMYASLQPAHIRRMINDIHR
ncbi:hypothetical protein D3C71_1851040 [compost metagenome]